MVANASSADLQKRMRQARQDLDSHSDEMVKQARETFNWRNFVAKHPVATMSAAAVAGYLLAPRRIHLKSVDDKTIKAAVEQALEKVQPAMGAASNAAKSPGLVAGLASMLMAVLVREGLSMASQMVRNVVDSKMGGADRMTGSFSQHPSQSASLSRPVARNGEHP
jgi:hypothetical protein